MLGNYLQQTTSADVIFFRCILSCALRAKVFLKIFFEKLILKKKLIHHQPQQLNIADFKYKSNNDIEEIYESVQEIWYL